MRRMDSSTNRLTHASVAQKSFSVRFTSRHFTRLLFFASGALIVALARGAMASPSSAVALLVLGYLGLHLIDQHLRD